MEQNSGSRELPGALIGAALAVLSMVLVPLGG
jgi:hypothetical protein